MGEKSYICPQNYRYEETFETDFLLAGARSFVLFMCFVKVAGHA